MDHLDWGLIVKIIDAKCNICGPFKNLIKMKLVFCQIIKETPFVSIFCHKTEVWFGVNSTKELDNVPVTKHAQNTGLIS